MGRHLDVAKLAEHIDNLGTLVPALNCLIVVHRLRSDVDKVESVLGCSRQWNNKRKNRSMGFEPTGIRPGCIGGAGFVLLDIALRRDDLAKAMEHATTC